MAVYGSFDKEVAINKITFTMKSSLTDVVGNQYSVLNFRFNSLLRYVQDVNYNDFHCNK